MSKEEQSGYTNTIVDECLPDLADTVEYDECPENIDINKSNYDQLSPVRDGLNHDYMTLTSTLKTVSKHSDNEVKKQKQSLLRLLCLIMCCILISSGVTAAATFFATKHKYSGHNGKYSNLCNTSSGNDNNRTIDKPGSCSKETCENGGTCIEYTCVCEDGFAGLKCEIDVNQTCKYDADTFIPHPNTCQLFYNCSQAVSPIPTANRIYTYLPQTLRPAYLHECPYPELFSTTTMSCLNYTDVKCGSRYETKNKCEYLTISYICNAVCKACVYFSPGCTGVSDGIHRNRYIYPPGEQYFECQDERNINNYVRNPCQTNMIPFNGKCTDIFEISPSYWQVGYGESCYGRPNGNYNARMDRGRCDIYFTCADGNPTLTTCSAGKVFDTKSTFCQDPSNACRPCGSKTGCY